MRAWIARGQQLAERWQGTLAGAVLLLARLWVAVIFLRAGWLKFTAWDSTLYLFEFEYQVPLLPWLWAAYLGTATELLLPLFLLAGLFTRPAALLLFGFNAMAVISYPTLWAGGFYDHQLWGWMLLTLVVWGAGPLALDSWRLARGRGGH
ncbi:DoxX family protein [Aeromonas bivalvium]|uniref:DoxX family protein n=1 Tax=Aeromonas bivalvium TaxID=440079 RepID=UPI0005A82C0C|nr:DoxX family protein [Aeromonas bivalvium]